MLVKNNFKYRLISKREQLLMEIKEKKTNPTEASGIMERMLIERIMTIFALLITSTAKSDKKNS
jgi:hypothetical protein